MSRVRLDANSQASSYLGKYWIDRTSWTEYTTVSFPYATGSVGIHPNTVFVLFGATDGQVIAIETLGGGVLNLVSNGRAGMWVYCFGARNVTVSNSGLQLLDTAGVVTFDSQAKWLRMAGVINSPAFNTYYSWPSGVPAIAVGMSHRGNWIQQNQIGQRRAWIMRTHGLQVITGSAKISSVDRQRPFAEFPPANTPAPPIGNLIFADVTRY